MSLFISKTLTGMADKWAEEIQHALILRESFKCWMCGLLLRSPVMLIDTIGNVCHDCYRKLTIPVYISAIENCSVNKVLKIMTWPCDHCSLMFNSDTWRHHNEFCRHRTLSCEITNCSWKGARKDYIVHFEEHNDQINTVTRDDDHFPLPKVEDHELKSVILDTSIGKFVAHMFLHKHKLHIALVDVGYLPKTKEYKCYLQCSNPSGNLLKYMCKVVDSNKILELPLDEHYTVLNIVFLKHLLGNSGMITYKLVMSNIGDFTCQTCLGKAVPNRSVKGFCSNLRQGCRVRNLVHDRGRHEEICHYRPHECPVGCGILPIPFLQLVHHLTHKHATVVIRSNQFVFSLKGPHFLQSTLTVLALNEIFKVQLGEGDNETRFRCCITHIGPHERRCIMGKADIWRINGSRTSVTCVGEFIYKNNVVISTFYIKENLTQVETLKFTILKLR